MGLMGVGGDGVNAAVRKDSCLLGSVRSLSDLVFGFFEEGDHESPENEWEEYEDDEDEVEDPALLAEKSAFWASQHQLLQEAMSSRSSLETKVCRATEEALRKTRSEGGGCSCSRIAGRNKECRNCTLRAISDALRRAGFDCGLCKSKWRSSPGIPSGEHSYLDVVHKPSNNRKSPTRVVIELNFRAEFEMARASHDYSSLMSKLPEVFVGKPEKLKGVIKAVCAAAKMCMKDNKMHMGPWRKHKYMQAKWLASSFERMVTAADTVQLPVLEGGGGGRRTSRPRASMLTFDLDCTAVEVA